MKHIHVLQYKDFSFAMVALGHRLACSKGHVSLHSNNPRVHSEAPAMRIIKSINRYEPSLFERAQF
ncbi:MAG: hypothetical protein M3Q16_01075 [Pseudomonadota bacterium]|nr:hypothetical protein [Pseudomonadota bacterium]